MSFLSIGLCGCAAFALYRTREVSSKFTIGMYGFLIAHSLFGIINLIINYFVELPEFIQQAYEYSKMYTIIVPLVIINKDVVGDEEDLFKMNSYINTTFLMAAASIDIFLPNVTGRVFNAFVVGYALCLCLISIHTNDQFGIVIAALQSFTFFWSSFFAELLDINEDYIFSGGLCGLVIFNYFRQILETHSLFSDSDSNSNSNSV